MATTSGGTPTPVAPGPKIPGPIAPRAVADDLFARAYEFDFFQAVRLLERLFPKLRAVGRGAKPDGEVVRFKSWYALKFPSATVYDLKPPEGDSTTIVKPPQMVITFLSMAGSSGVLPRHYTEMILRIDRDVRGPERTALREFLDLFTHRFASLFFRAWEKYRFMIAYERGEYALRDPDAFTHGLFSLVGLGTSGLRERMRVAIPDADSSPRDTVFGQPKETVLGKIDDLSTLWFAGFFAQRPRNAFSLEAMLAALVRLPVKVCQFQGQWLRLDAMNQSVMGPLNGNNCLGRNVIVGDRIWDVQSKIRIQLGPMTYAQFLEFLPDRAPRPERKGIFLLAQFVRLYLGPEIDVEFQLILKKEEVPGCKIGPGLGLGSRLGWNTWSKRKPLPRDAADAVFQAEEMIWIRPNG
jgi:type VI secretion system protein ImpH